MIKFILRKIFGTANERELKKLQPIVDQVNRLEPEIKSLSDADLKDKTRQFKERLAAGKSLEDLLVEAFAVVREAARRTIGMRHYDVQLVGGVVLHQGKVAEMKTGEGKTLVATLPAYLNALDGKGVHVVTVNDYLARRDSEWMGEVYRFLGLSVGLIQNDMDESQRQVAYAADIVYGTNNEYGFDYLRDNMKFDRADQVQRNYSFAIVDEVDSILIDEARTPLIISGPTEESTSFYYHVDNFIKKINRDPECYEKDEKSKSITLTEKGIAEAEKYFRIENLYELENMDTLHQVNQSLKAHFLFARDKDYLVKDGKVFIVDEFTGRIMPGRRFSDGLHQALEAKEQVKIEQEYQTHASITFQNYFRMYDKLAGMTGTAVTEAKEFESTYKLDVLAIPTNRPLRRTEFSDIIYGSKAEKWDAVVQEIKDLNAVGRPALVGTISIENSELVSRRLKREGLKHVVLNAKYHEMEASIVAQAGRQGAITIATNMAGRGTDIILGGNREFLLEEALKKRGFSTENAPKVVYEEVEKEVSRIVETERDAVVKVGGLHIVGTERHEARRIDNQLRGRAGRQGDPGSSRFFVSLEDDLMKILGSDRIRGLLVRSGMRDGVPIENKLISRAIENAQKQIESQNFSMRKHLLEYDDVMDKQRKHIYRLRQQILEGRDLSKRIQQWIEDIYLYILEEHTSGVKNDLDLETEAFAIDIKGQFNFDLQQIGEIASRRELEYGEIKKLVLDSLYRLYQERETLFGQEEMRRLERVVLLNVIDNQWKDHLLNIDHLKEGIQLRGYAQKDPLIEYKKESFDLFEDMQNRIEEETVRVLYRIEPVKEEDVQKWKQKKQRTLNKPTSRIHSSKRHRNKKKKDKKKRKKSR